MLIDTVRLQLDTTEFTSKRELLLTIENLLDELFDPDLWDEINQHRRVIGVDEITISIDREYVLKHQNWLEDDFEEFTPIITGNTSNS